MNINIRPRIARNQRKIYYSFAWGKGAGQRKGTGIFTYADPVTAEQSEYNKEALRNLEMLRSQLVLEWQTIGTGIFPKHRVSPNFIDFFKSYVKRNKQENNRHLDCCFTHFKLFLKTSFISPIDITEELCFRFRRYLFQHLNGESPANYFARFKRVIRAATKQGYFHVNPCQDIPVKSNKNKQRKAYLEVEEYLALLNTPFLNSEVRDAFIFCCYTGLRWCDIKVFTATFIKNEHTIFQVKTGVEHYISLHPIAKAILEKRLARLQDDAATTYLFNLPTANGANKLLKEWCRYAQIEKHITWNCARLSFSILLQDERVDAMTVALLLGHTSTRQVNETYKRYRPKNQMTAISKLPYPNRQLCFYDICQDVTLARTKIFFLG